jgi:flagellar hook-length control protein FliK
LYTSNVKEKVSSGSITRDTDGLDRKEGLKYGGRTVVNPLLFANSSLISLSALSGGNSAVTSSNNNNTDTTNNFNNIINGLLSNATSAENQTQSSGAASNQQIKSALYQAVAMLYITGGISSVASQDTAAIAKNTAVSTVIQNNNLTPAQIQIFLTTLKSAAMSIVSDPSIFGATEKGSADTFSSLIQNGNNNGVPVNLSYQNVSESAVNQNVGQPDNSSNDSARLPEALVLQQALSQGQTVVNTLQTSDAAGKSAAPVAGIFDSQQMSTATQTADAVKGITAQLGKLQELANTIENILAAKTAGTNSSSANNTTDNNGTTALAEMIKTLNSDIAGALKYLSSISTVDSTQQVSKTLLNVKNLIDDAASTLNSIMASATAMQMIPQAMAIPAVITSSNDILISNQPSTSNSAVAVTLSNSGNAYLKQDGNTGITTSNQTQLIDIASSITALLREMNGKLEVISKYDYTTVNNNNNSNAEVKIAQTTSPINAAVSGSDISFKGQPNENVQTGLTTGENTNFSPQQPVNQPDVMDTNTAGDSGVISLSNNLAVAPEILAPINITMASENKASSAIISGQDVAQPVLDNNILMPAAPLTQDAAVIAAAQLLNNDSIKYQPDNASKNLTRDINWLANNINNIVKPALTADTLITSNLAQNVSTAPSFTSMAAFAKSAMDQVVLKQVVMNLNNSQPTRVDEIRMTLRPENLGTVIVKIDHSNNEIKGSFVVSNNDVKDALKSGLPDLKNTLNNLGIKADSISVTVSDSNAGAYDHGSNGRFNEWEGAVAPAVINDFNGNVDAYLGGDGSFNYLA